MTKTQINEEYCNWLSLFVCRHDPSLAISFRKLFNKLYSTEFIWVISRDENRAVDGFDLRADFAYDIHENYIPNIQKHLPPYCTVLEMMVALSIRLEQILEREDNDQTSLWFWMMIQNMGLENYPDEHFIEEYVDEIIFNMLHHRYDSNGKGGLFYTDNSKIDMRNLELWAQMCTFANYIS